MTSLIAQSPFEDRLPRSIGKVDLGEVDLGRVTFVQPLKGQADAVASALKSALGFGLPGPGEAIGSPDARALWCGPGQALVMGDCPSLPGAAMVDQSDAFASLRLEGADTRGVLARLTPLDMRPGVFGPGQTARTLIGHMTGQITPVAADAFEVMVFRSMAGTLLHEVTRAAKFVAGRAALGQPDF